MHILINGWFWGQSTTGSGQYLHRLVEHLARTETGTRFTLLTPKTRDWRLEIEDGASQSLISNLQSPIPPLPRQLAKLYWEQIAVPSAARRLGANLIFVPYWAAPLWQPVPTVVTVHDLIPLLLPAYQGGALNRLYTVLVSATAARAAAVITVSRAGARDVTTHLLIPPARVFPVHHGPNVAARPLPDDHELAAIRAKYDLPERYFLYLGGFDVRKNVAGILAAYRRYLDKGGDPAVKLVLAGRLPDADTPFFPDPRRIGAELGVSEQLHCTGWVEETDKPLLYAGAVAFLFPSHYEGFGMMILEAMAAGCPVISSQSPRAS
ncbi:MAG: glycosyltransferase family 4 protein [Chloroflexi bacterium]|nr:glycosyltransferase family 4 protein [Chloroflexota bacterium]